MNDEPGTDDTMIDNPLPLSPQQEQFCAAYADPESETYGKAGMSAKVAGYIEPYTASWKLRRQARIIARLEQYQAAARVTVGRVMSDLEAERLLALAKDPPDVAAAIRASELMGKHLAMFTEHVQVDVGQAKVYSDAERAEARRLAAMLITEQAGQVPMLERVPDAAVEARR